MSLDSFNGPLATYKQHLATLSNKLQRFFKQFYFPYSPLPMLPILDYA
jgi:hypothetical protein